MIGESVSPEDDAAGIVPRAVQAIFRRIRARGIDHSVSVSCLELYNEKMTEYVLIGETVHVRCDP